MADDVNNRILSRGGLYIPKIIQDNKISQKDTELGPNQDPILYLDKILENLYNQISLRIPVGLWTLRFMVWELERT